MGTFFSDIMAVIPCLSKVLLLAALILAETDCTQRQADVQAGSQRTYDQDLRMVLNEISHRLKSDLFEFTRAPLTDSRSYTLLCDHSFGYEWACHSGQFDGNGTICDKSLERCREFALGDAHAKVTSILTLMTFFFEDAVYVCKEWNSYIKCELITPPTLSEEYFGRPKKQYSIDILGPSLECTEIDEYQLICWEFERTEQAALSSDNHPMGEQVDNEYTYMYLE